MGGGRRGEGEREGRREEVVEVDGGVAIGHNTLGPHSPHEANHVYGERSRYGTCPWVESPWKSVKPNGLPPLNTPHTIMAC